RSFSSLHDDTWPAAPSTVLARAATTLSQLLRVNRALTITGLLMAATVLATLIGLLVDPRVITGAPAWLKPTKFAISTSLYAFTFVWLLGFVQGHRRLVTIIASGTAAALSIEVALIIVQVVRGTTSHFNYTTLFDAALFSTMGVIIVGAWLLAAAAAILLLIQRLADPAFAWALRLGLLIALVGMAVAFFMPAPTPDQLAALQAGVRPTSLGAHSVGPPDGGPGLPLVGWSTLAGDLRVAHFVGLHALQVLPLLGWLLARRTSLPTRHRLGLVWVAGLSYLGLVVILTWQALRGQSVIAPDALTLLALASLVAAAGLSSLVILSGPTSQSGKPAYGTVGGRVA
ncbi:MAG TPA: hypothetical protein VGE94_05880, partial [Chloroflexota bacterium]